jgi:DNA-directed RNA polymerase specialized sigma24 family protein
MEDDAPWAHTADEELDPDAQTERALTRRRVEDAWRYLDATQRALLSLHDVEGHTLAEIAELTGSPQGTIKSRLFRARERLGRLLQRKPAPIAGCRRGGLSHQLRTLAVSARSVRAWQARAER